MPCESRSGNQSGWLSRHAPQSPLRAPGRNGIGGYFTADGFDSNAVRCYYYGRMGD